MTADPPDRPSAAPDARPGQPLERTWGLPLLVGGLTLAIGRFTLLPLTLDPPWLSTVLAGLGGAGFVLGISTLARGRGEARWPVALLGAVAAALLALGGLTLLRPTPLGTAALAPFETDAFSLDVPQWATPDLQQFGGQGRLAVGRSEQGRVLELNWLAAEPATLDELIGALSAALEGLGAVERIPADPVPGPAGAVPLGALHVPDKDTSTAMAVIGCPSGISITLSLTAREPPAEVVALATRVIASIRCAEGDAVPKVMHARWTPPEGFAVEPDSGDSVTYSRAFEGGWEGLALMPMTPDVELSEKMQRMPRLAESMIGAIFPGARPIPAPATATADGQRRHFYAFEMDDAETGERVKMLITVWPCPQQAASGLAMYMGAGIPDFDRGVELLVQPRCPAP